MNHESCIPNFPYVKLETCSQQPPKRYTALEVVKLCKNQNQLEKHVDSIFPFWALSLDTLWPTSHHINNSINDTVVNITGTSSVSLMVEKQVGFVVL